ncbi:MAG: peptidylprolyl isomerase, partial [Acidimicrobiales bacterium]
MRKLLLTVAAVLGAGLAATACNPVTPYAAVVNGTVITQGQLNSEMAAIAGNKSDVASIEAGATSNGAGSLTITGAGPGTYGATFASEVLREEILYVLIDQELARRHVSVSSYDLTAARADVPGALQGSGQTAVVLSDFPRAYQNLLIRRQADLEALEADLGGQVLTQASVAAYYAAHQAEFYEACASRIQVATALAALGVEADLAKGTSFAAEAAAKSTDTQTSSQGGQLGCGSGLQFTSSFGAAFSQAVATTPIGKPSAAVPGPTGYDIVEVSQRQPLPLANAYSQIRQ